MSSAEGRIPSTAAVFAFAVPFILYLVIKDKYKRKRSWQSWVYVCKSYLLPPFSLLSYWKWLMRFLFFFKLFLLQDHYNESECRHLVGQTFAAQQSFKASSDGAIQLAFQLYRRSTSRNRTHLWIGSNSSGKLRIKSISLIGKKRKGEKKRYLCISVCVSVCVCRSILIDPCHLFLCSWLFWTATR